MTALVITATLGFMILLILIDTYRTNAKIKRMVRESWGKPPVTRFRKDRLESVETYWEEKKLRLGHGRYVDDITWNDLDMDLIFSQLNSTFSSVGAEYMYARLHELCFDQAELQAFDELGWARWTRLRWRGSKSHSAWASSARMILIVCRTLSLPPATST